MADTEFEKRPFEIIREKLKGIKKAAVSAHANPDGDAVGSVLALAMVLKQMGVEPVVLLEEYADRFNFIKGREFIYTGDYAQLEMPVFFALDCGDKNRLGDRAVEVFDRTPLTFNIDHHMNNPEFATYNLVKPDVSSASEIVFDIIKDNCELTKEIATAIYAGIIYDTSGFKHSCTGVSTHLTAAALVEKGVDTAFIHSKMLYEHTTSQLKVMRCALKNMKTEGEVAWTVLSKEEMDECGAKNGDTDGVAEYLLNTENIEVSALLTEKKDNFVKISLRSKQYNINKVAAFYGGGGHMLASGAGLEMPLSEAEKSVVEKIKEEIANEKQ